MELAQAGILLTREFLRLYNIDFKHYMDELRKRPLHLATLSSSEKVRELYAEFHLVSASEFDSGHFKSLDDPSSRNETFVDELAFLALHQNSDFGAGGADIAKSLAQGNALRFLNLAEAQLIGRYSALSGASSSKAGEPGSAVDPLDAQAQKILTSDGTSRQISSDGFERGRVAAARLIALCRELREHAYPAFPLFGGILARSDSRADLEALLRFLYEYSLPDSFAGVDPSLRSANNRLYALEKRLAILRERRKTATGQVALAIESDVAAIRAEEREILQNRFKPTSGESLAEGARPVNPEALVIQSAIVDELMKNATESYSRDLQMGILDPLVAWIKSNNRGHKDGLVMSGNLELSVTSSRSAVSSGQATLYAPYTPQQQLTPDQITSLFKAATPSPLGAESIAKALAAIGPPSPTFSSIAPGLDLSVITTVLPGGSSARLQINFRANNQVTSDPKRSAPIPAVNSHEVRTDVAVGAFDLFPLSTFNVETTTLGDPQWRIYGLEGIPIIGNIFIGPRRPVTSVSRSLVIVYTTVLPRSLDLARRYSSDND